MSAPEGNSLFCFPESLNVSRDEVEGNIDGASIEGNIRWDFGGQMVSALAFHR
jgi:hypothetical protein